MRRYVLIIVLVLACNPGAPSSAPASSATSASASPSAAGGARTVSPRVVCSRLSRRDCEGLSEAATLLLPPDAGPIERIIVEPDCPPGRDCDPRLRTWVVFTFRGGDPQQLAFFLLGDPSGPPRGSQVTGSLPPHVEERVARP